ncbi:hypothetical protein [Desulfitobacterium sp.]|uniref:hypothetical protein n=1 Tax=Desulfitobacterium sp. TaxID=49981 RepID=UPI002B2206BC|nr:hypothetical protein [Desulfitobacterium sp.]MEA4903135.1 hypothetical protein [Desulfitobacterium sp.]
MNKDELLRQVNSTMANGKELDKVKVKFTDGQVFKFDFINETIEEELDQDDDDDDDNDDNDDDDDEDEEIRPTNTSNQASFQGSSQTVQAGQRKVNVINR